MVRIFQVQTETKDKLGGHYDSYDVAAQTAEDAIVRAKKKFNQHDEQVLGVRLLASESE